MCFVFFALALHFKIAKFPVWDMLRLPRSRSRLFQHCRVFAHCVTKMPSRRIHEDAKTRKRLRLPSSVLYFTLHCYFYPFALFSFCNIRYTFYTFLFFRKFVHYETKQANETFGARTISLHHWHATGKFIEERCIQKRKQRSSLLFGGQNF